MDKLVSEEGPLRVKTGLVGRPGRNLFALVASMLVAAVWLCSGCIPLKYNTSPGAIGRVVDGSTHAPLNGAQVVVSRSTYPPDSPDKAFANAREPKVTSHEGGAFSIPPQRRWDLYCVPVDFFPRFGLLVVKCRGYQTTCVPFWSRSVADLGEIVIAPGQKDSERK